MKVLFFAWLKNEITNEIEINLAKPISIDQLKDKIIADYGEKARILYDESILVAINHEYKTNADIVTNNDEVAFFPPVTGG